jgi:hypothetical protein
VTGTEAPIIGQSVTLAMPSLLNPTQRTSLMIEPTEYLRLSYSSLNVFSSCPRKFELDKFYPKLQFDGDNYAADVGKALHAGFQQYLINQDESESIWEFMKVFPYVGEFSQDNDYRSFEAALETLQEMFIESNIQEYKLAQIKRPDGQTVPAIEVPFEIRLKGITLPDGRGVSIIGYIDAIMEHLMTRMYRTVDIKTSRMSLHDATGKFKFDGQQVPYGIVVEQVGQGVVDEYEVIYFDCYIDVVQPRVNLYKFLKTKVDVQEWLWNKLIQIEQIKRFMEIDYFPRTEGGCLAYNRPCRYLEPCISRDRETLESWFTMGGELAEERPFDPWITVDIDVRGDES